MLRIKTVQMDSISLPVLAGISQWTLFLGIGLIVFGIIEKRDNYILAGQIALVALGALASWILLTKAIPLPPENAIIISKEAKALSFFKGAVFVMLFSIIAILQKIFRLPYQKACIYFLILFSLFLFFMLFNILQTPNIT